MLEVGQRLRTLREGVKLSQARIGKLLGTTQASINRYETGTSSPTLETLLWYADYFDVSMDYIFGRTDKPQGKLYKYQPKYLSEDNEMRQFVEMCFDPNSPVNDKLKQMIVDMLREGKK